MNTSFLPSPDTLRHFFSLHSSGIVEEIRERSVTFFRPTSTSWRWFRCFLAAVLIFSATLLHSQAAASSSTYSAIKSFRIVQEKDGPAVEILSTKPLIPTIKQLGD